MGQLRCLPYKKRFFLWDEQDAHQSIGSNISVELKFIGAVGYAVVNPLHNHQLFEFYPM